MNTREFKADELNKNLQGAIAILLEDGETAKFE